MAKKLRLDLSFHHALPVMLYQARKKRVYVVGLGGTGGFVARHAACIVWLLKTMGQDASLTFIDPDQVEEANIPRQNFCMAEIGRYKAETLATRYAQAFGMEISVIVDPFAASMVKEEWDALCIVVGCVDSAAGRIQMEQTLDLNGGRSGYPPRVGYLDSGNGRDFGQILLGTTRHIDDLARAFSLGALPRCYMLPSPLLLQPHLRKVEPLEEAGGERLSCAQQLLANAQSLTINAAMADELADYLYRLLITGDLKKFATYIDQPSGTKRSLYTSRESLAGAIHRDLSFFIEPQALPYGTAEAHV